MESSGKIKRGESIIYLILWAIIMLMPIFISNTGSGIDWSRVNREWIRLLPFLFVFLAHNYILFPRLFFLKKRTWYFLSVIALILAIGFISELITNLVDLQANIPMPSPRHGEMPDIHGGPPRPQPIHKILIDNVFISILVVGFNAAIKVGVIWQDEEQKNKELEKEKLKTELAFLKNQVSPHFFMNTLNNIHALIDINPEDAKKSVIKLSKLMRYLLYGSEGGKTTLAKEIEFIKNYVDLMKLRFTSQVSIKLSVPENIPNIEIPPMLFTSLLENAFKHGISYQQKSFVDIIINADMKFLYFRIINSKRKGDNGINEDGGIGLENLRKRLELIYQKQYSLEQKEDAGSFEINIKLPTNG